MVSASERGQVSRSAAEVYDEFFVPALFEQWTERVADAAAVGPGRRVLDVACGTGVLARAAARRTGGDGAVVGLDCNEGMLEVARRRHRGIEWRQGRAEALPFADGSFDAVVSQFGLMFFEDRRAALVEMRRILAPGGSLAVAVWDGLERAPGYAAMAELLQRLFGDEVASALRAPFALGDADAFAALCASAGMPEVAIARHAGTARFSSLAAWLHTDIRGWTLAEAIDDEQFERLRREADTALAGFVTAGGGVEFPVAALIASFRAPPGPG